MKYGTREHMGASLKVGVASGLPVHMRGDIIEISSVFTKPQFRRQGYASELIAQVALEADLARKMLLVRVDEGLIGGADKQALINLYGRHGFVPVQAEPLLMVRAHIAMAVRGNA